MIRKLDMGLDVVSGIIFFTYTVTCCLSIIFTFSIDLYRRIEEKAGLEIFSNPTLIPILEGNIDFINEWIEENHRIIGPILIASSIVDLRLCLKIIMLSSSP